MISNRFTGQAAGLLIFDHDGVLVDSEIIAMSVIVGLLAEYGIHVTVDAATHPYLGDSLDLVMATIEGSGVELDRAHFHSRFDDALFRDFRRELNPGPGMRVSCHNSMHLASPS